MSEEREYSCDAVGAEDRGQSLVEVLLEWHKATDFDFHTTCATCDGEDGNHEIGRCEFWRLKMAIEEYLENEAGREA